MPLGLYSEQLASLGLPVSGWISPLILIPVNWQGLACLRCHGAGDLDERRARMDTVESILEKAIIVGDSRQIVACPISAPSG